MELSAGEVRRAWARASGLAGSRSDDASPATVVAAAAGIQAQDRRAARLSIRARARHVDAAAIEHALAGERSVVRTWTMRGTLHLVPAADVRWLLDLLGPVFVAAGGRRYRQLGLDERTCGTAVGAIGEAVATEGPLTRAALAERIRAAGVDVETGSQTVAHLVRRAALEGVLCCGPDVDGSETYVALDDWVQGRVTLSGDAALAELARRHLLAFGPARPEDFASWSGLPTAKARDAWRLLDAELLEVVAAGRPAWVMQGTDVGADDGGGPCVRLLPAFDTYLLGHKDRGLIVEDRFARRVWPGGGWIHPTAVVDGAVVATWSIGSGRRSPAVEVAPFAALDSEVAELVETEASRLRAFLGAA